MTSICSNSWLVAWTHKIDWFVHTLSFFKNSRTNRKARFSADLSNRIIQVGRNSRQKCCSTSQCHLRQCRGQQWSTSLRGRCHILSPTALFPPIFYLTCRTSQPPTANARHAPSTAQPCHASSTAQSQFQPLRSILRLRPCSSL